MKIQRKETDIMESNVTVMNDKLDLLRYTSEVQSRINRDITSDFILCKLGDKDKEGVVEMVGNAYYLKKIISNIHEKAFTYVWNEKEDLWEKTRPTDKVLKRILQYGNQSFDAFMIRIYMITILNRNVSQNHLIRLLTGHQEEEGEENREEGKMVNKLKELMKNRETEKSQISN